MNPDRPNIARKRTPTTFHFVEAKDPSVRRAGSRDRDSRSHAARISSQRSRDHRRAKSALVLSTDDQERLTSPATETVGYFELKFSESSLTLPRPVSPVFSGLSVESFDVEGPGSTTAAETADYCFRTIMDILHPNDIPIWFTAFCRYPLVFHALSFTVDVHRQIRSRSSRTLQRTLAHKVRTIQLVNEALLHIDSVDTNLESLILTVTCLWRCNIPDKEESASESLFEPLLPEANWIALFSRAEADESHARAVHWLVNKAGGIQNLNLLPGLDVCVSIADLLSSSKSTTTPTYPYPHASTTWLDAFLAIPQEATSIGEGFVFEIPSGLLGFAIRTFQRLACISTLLSTQKGSRSKPDDDYRRLIHARSAVQHALLSMPAWDELTPTAREESLKAPYETCRLAALIYSNAVIFPVGITSTETLVERLQTLLETSNLTRWKGSQAKSLGLWALFIGTLATYDGEGASWTYFVRELRRLVGREYAWDQEAVERDLRQFLWEDGACGQGLEVVWQELRKGRCGV